MVLLAEAVKELPGLCVSPPGFVPQLPRMTLEATKITRVAQEFLHYIKHVAWEILHRPQELIHRMT